MYSRELKSAFAKVKKPSTSSLSFQKKRFLLAGKPFSVTVLLKEESSYKRRSAMPCNAETCGEDEDEEGVKEEESPAFNMIKLGIWVIRVCANFIREGDTIKANGYCRLRWCFNKN